MLEDVVRLVIALLVPAPEESAIARMLRNFALALRRRGALQLLHEL